MIKYAMMQAIRVVCIIACLFVTGWWILIPAVGAIFLPYVAVVVANSLQQNPRATVERPGSIVPVNPVPVNPVPPFNPEGRA
ncbi:hypothetical protein BH10ACT6_BH10ACT6_06990 [soil metagenome]